MGKTPDSNEKRPRGERKIHWSQQKGERWDGPAVALEKRAPQVHAHLQRSWRGKRSQKEREMGVRKCHVDPMDMGWAPGPPVIRQDSGQGTPNHMGCLGVLWHAQLADYTKSRNQEEGKVGPRVSAQQWWWSCLWWMGQGELAEQCWPALQPQFWQQRAWKKPKQRQGQNKKPAEGKRKRKGPTGFDQWRWARGRRSWWRKNRRRGAQDCLKKAKKARDLTSAVCADFEDCLAKANQYLTKQAKQNGLKDQQVLVAMGTRLKDAVTKENLPIKKLKALLQENANKIKEVKETMKELKQLANKASSIASKASKKWSFGKKDMTEWTLWKYGKSQFWQASFATKECGRRVKQPLEKRMCIAFGKIAHGKTAWKKQALDTFNSRSPLSMSLREPLKERWFLVFSTSDHGQTGQKKDVESKGVGLWQLV